MIFVLCVMTGNQTSTVLGCYDTISRLKDAANIHRQKSKFAENHYFYYFKELNADAEWMNNEMAVRF